MHNNVCSVGARIRTSMFVSDGLGPYIDGKDSAYDRSNGWKSVYFAPELAFSLSSYFDLITFPILYLDLECKRLSFPPRKKYKFERRDKFLSKKFPHLTIS